MTVLTKWTKSLAAMARMSAHETTPGHLLSTSAFAFFMPSNASTARFLLSCASFSARPPLPGFDDSKIDASHPYNPIQSNPKDQQSDLNIHLTQESQVFLIIKRLWMVLNGTWTKQSWKNKRMVAGAETGASWNCWDVTEATSCSSCGHVLE